MFRYEKKCRGCEELCPIKSSGYWHHPKIADNTFHDIDKLNTEFEAVDYAEKISTLCEYYGTTGQPCVVEKKFKIKETCDGCDMHCRIKAIKNSNHFEIQIGHDLISDLTFRNKYDTLTKAFDLVKHCAHRNTK